MKNLFINLPIKLSLFHLKIKFHRNKSKRKGRYSTLTCHKNFIPSKKSTRQNLANFPSPKETNFEDRLTLLSNFQPNYPFPTFPFLELTSLSLSLCICAWTRDWYVLFPWFLTNDLHIPHVPNPTANERNGWKIDRNLRARSRNFAAEGPRRGFWSRNVISNLGPRRVLSTRDTRDSIRAGYVSRVL